MEVAYITCFINHFLSSLSHLSTQNNNPAETKKLLKFKPSPLTESEKKKKRKSPSHVQFFAIPRTIACQAPLSMGLSRQEYWSGLPIPSPGDLSKRGTELWSLALHAESLPIEPPGKPLIEKLQLNLSVVEKSKVGWRRAPRCVVWFCFGLFASPYTVG